MCSHLTYTPGQSTAQGHFEQSGGHAEDVCAIRVRGADVDATTARRVVLGMCQPVCYADALSSARIELVQLQTTLLPGFVLDVQALFANA